MLIAALLVSAAGKADDLNMPNPENVLVLPSGDGGLFSRWMAAPAAAAMQRRERNSQRVGAARRRPIITPPDEPDKVVPQAAQPDWPIAAETVGLAAIVPLTIKTVREIIEPEPDMPLVFENELSDIDIAAGPALDDTRSAAPQAMTDGSGAIDHETVEQAGIVLGETVKAMMQSAWLEPLLLVLAGLLAAFTAVRTFA
jgi:hypothetical protein